MMMRKLIFTLAMSLITIATISAHDYTCAHDVTEQSMATTFPKYASDRIKLEMFTLPFMRTNSNARMLSFGCQLTAAVYEIPLVVNVMYTNGTNNISDAQINQGIADLNSFWVPQMGIKFVLAKTDPDGNPTTGINRVNCTSIANLESIGIDPSTNPVGAPDTLVKNKKRWDWRNYINLWIVPKSAVGAAYANMPSSYDFQGLVIPYNAFGVANNTTTCAHEMGHYFNLFHTFQGSSGTTCALNSDPLNQGDKVPDTWPCLQSDCSSLSCGIFSNPENIFQNLMGYCTGKNLFTAGQKQRVLAALFSEYRWSLVTSPGLIPVDVATEVSLDSLSFEEDLSQALCNGWLTPKIQIKNYGNTVSSMELEVSYDGVDSIITVTVGFLRGSNNWLSLYPKRFSISGSHNIEVRVRKVNNTTDYNLMNNNTCLNVDVIVQSITVSTSVNIIGAGTITGAGTFSCNGIWDTLKVITNTGYVFQNIKKGNVVVSTSPTYAFPIDLSQGNHAYTANFAIQTFTVSATANPSNGGSVTGAGTYNYGSDVTVMFKAKAGYQLTGVTLNGSPIPLDSVITLTALSSNTTLVGNFALKTFTINVTSNSIGGTVSGGNPSITYGSTATVTATESSCYTFSGWYEGGILVFSNKIYTFTVTGSRNLEARFVQKQFLIVAVANNNALGTTTGGDTYGCGTMATVRAHVKSGGKFVNWTDNTTGLIVFTDSVYPFQAATGRTLIANFEQVQLAKVNAGSDQSICFGDSATLSATNSTNYLWNTGANTQSIRVSPTVTTSYVVTGLNGTKDTVKITVKNLPNVVFTKTVEGNRVQFTAPGGNNTYSWNFGDALTSTEQNPLHTYATNGVKYVTLTSTLNGCSATRTDSVTISSIPTGIYNNSTEIESNIYPNPTSGYLNIRIISPGTYNGKIYNLVGDLLWSDDTVKQVTVDVTGFAKGIYILKLDDGNTIISKQFLVQ